MLIQKISAEGKQIIRRLERLTIIVSQYRHGLLHFHELYMCLIDASGSLSTKDANIFNLTVEVLSEDCQYLIKLLNVAVGLENLGLFFQSKIENIDADAMDMLL